MITKVMGALPRTLWAILGVALALRLLGAGRANLIFDERAHLALADTISLRPGQLHLVSRSLDHPFLSIYILKVSSLLFGSSDFSLRILYVLAGTMTVLCAYALGRSAFGQRAGLWAAALLAVDQFHASWSRVFMPEVWLMLFSSLVLWQCGRTLRNESTKNFVVLGVLLGLAYLAKEPGILLVPALWIALIVSPESRRVLRQPRWYLAHGVFLLVILPDLVWNLSQWNDSYLYRGAAFLSETWRLSLKSFSLYVGEIFQAVIGFNVLDSDYEAGGLYVSHWVAGLLYLAGVAAALPMWRTVEVRLLLATFVFVFGFFTLVPGGDRYDPFWWASVSLIPAVVCAGGLLDRISGGAGVAETASRATQGRKPPFWRAGQPVPRFIALILVGYLGVHYVPLAWRPGPFVPRPAVADLALNFSNIGDAALEQGLLDIATRHYIYVLNIGGPNRHAYLGLARIAELRGDHAHADALRARSAELDDR